MPRSNVAQRQGCGPAFARGVGFLLVKKMAWQPGSRDPQTAQKTAMAGKSLRFFPGRVGAPAPGFPDFQRETRPTAIRAGPEPIRTNLGFFLPMKVFSPAGRLTLP